MSWQIVMLLQIFASSLMTIFTRKLALSDRKLFFTVGVISYATVAVMGLIYALFWRGFTSVSNPQAWLYIVLEGICIPASWLLMYRIISILGASNAVVVATLNNVAVALLGVILLQESIGASFLAGAALLLGGVWVVLRIQPDIKHRSSATLPTKIALVSGMVVLFALGMFFEKLAISMIGVWNYAGVGWGMQFVGALVIWLIWGRSESRHLKPRSVRNSVILGIMTSIAGALYIYAVSIGTLSHTIIATSGKLALTMMLAAVIFGERNSFGRRFLAFFLAVCGLYLLFN